jgi:tetratricopeptide (TPR) repeat protein
MNRSRFFCSLLGAVSCLLPATAYAQSADQGTLAEALFRDAKLLMQHQRYAEACTKFSESQRLDPGGGTLLNLALCHEKQGRTATAWTEYHEALVQARKDGRADREQFAREHIAALDPQLARIVIQSDQDPSLEKLSVKVGGFEIAPAAWGTPVPVDPGSVEVEVQAPGKRPFRASFEVKPGSTIEARIPVLDAADPAEPVPVAKTRAPKPDPPLLAYTSLGAGAAAVFAGGYFGLQALAKWQQSKEHCPNDACDETGVRLSQEANRSAWAANVGIGIGLLGVGAGVYLLLRRDSRQREAAASAKNSWHFAIDATPKSAFASATRSF